MLVLHLFDFAAVNNKHHVIDSDARLGNVCWQNLTVTKTYATYTKNLNNNYEWTQNIDEYMLSR